MLDNIIVSNVNANARVAIVLELAIAPWTREWLASTFDMTDVVDSQCVAAVDVELAREAMENSSPLRQTKVTLAAPVTATLRVMMLDRIAISTENALVRVEIVLIVESTAPTRMRPAGDFDNNVVVESQQVANVEVEPNRDEVHECWAAHRPIKVTLEAPVVGPF